MEEVTLPSNSSENVPPPVPSPCRMLSVAKDTKVIYEKAFGGLYFEAETLPPEFSPAAKFYHRAFFNTIVLCEVQPQQVILTPKCTHNIRPRRVQTLLCEVGEEVFSYLDCYELLFRNLRDGVESRLLSGERFHKDCLHFTLVFSCKTELLYFRLRSLDGKGNGYFHRRQEILTLAASKVYKVLKRM